VIVADSSVLIDALTSSGPARTMLAGQTIHTPHLADIEIISALRGLVKSGKVPVHAASRCLAAWSRITVIKYPVTGLTDRIWELRSNLTAYDATYVALAEALQGELVTADARIAGAPALRCSVIVVPG
jgi:predicted nucleic acid-binding protein